MRTVIEQTGRTLKGFTKLVVDSVAEIADLPGLSSYRHGSECFCIENGITYYLRSDGNWIPPCLNHDMDPNPDFWGDPAVSANSVPIVVL